MCIRDSDDADDDDDDDEDDGDDYHNCEHRSNDINSMMVMINITSAGAVDREFVDIGWPKWVAQGGPWVAQ
eukprot:5172286-Karenia_brevis.AAC.1